MELGRVDNPKFFFIYFNKLHIDSNPIFSVLHLRVGERTIINIDL